MENAKIKKLYCDILSYFQTMCLKLTLPFVFSTDISCYRSKDRKKSRIRELVFLKMNSLPYFAVPPPLNCQLFWNNGGKKENNSTCWKLKPDPNLVICACIQGLKLGEKQAGWFFAYYTKYDNCWGALNSLQIENYGVNNGPSFLPEDHSEPRIKSLRRGPSEARTESA